MSTISESALVKRINRQLRPEMMLRKTRGERLRMQVGEYHVHDFRQNLILHVHVDPEAMGRELGVI